MKKFFRPKEAGTITPLPPTSPGADSSSFATPRPFEEYQARIASQVGDSNRPLSLQVTPVALRSAPDSPGRSDFTQADFVTSQQPHSQKLGASPRNNRPAIHFYATAPADAPYESYSDPISAPSQPFRPSYDRNSPSNYDPPISSAPRRANSKRSSQQQQHLPAQMTAFLPPRSLRPAQSSTTHRRDHSLSMGVASGAAFQNQKHSSNGDRNSLQTLPNHFTSTDSARAAARVKRSDDSYEPYYDDYEDSTDEHTPTASGAARSDAYPVYSGADGDVEAGEVLISQGCYEETTLRELTSKDKGKGKKLFGFATSSNKDKKAKQDRDITAAAPSPVPRDSRDPDDIRRKSPPLDSHPLSAQERSKEGGWMDRWNKRAHQQQVARLQDKEAEEAVASRIGWLSANACDDQDWMQMLPLIDMISHSEAASKEAARTLRKEFRYGTVDTQRRAVRVWALLALNASDHFRLQIASKRFLEAIEDTIASSKTPLSVKETMLRVLGVLAFEFKNDAELASVTKCWNKVKPNDRRKDGEPLENDLFEFKLPQPRASAQQMQQPSSRRVSQRHSQPPRRGADYHNPDLDALSPPQQRPVTADSAEQQQRPLSATFAPLQQPPPVPASLQPQAAPPLQQQKWSRSNLPLPCLDSQTHPTVPNVSPLMVVDHHESGNATEVVSTLEAAAASMDTRSASMQSGDSCFSPHHDVLAFDEDVRRLHEECQIARSNAAVLLDTLLQEGLHADTTELVDEFYIKLTRSQDLIASQIAWASALADRSRLGASMNEKETREETLLADLLETHGRSSEAIRMVEDARRRVEEEEAERRVTERSKVEVRLDRSALVQDSATGELYDVGSRGRAMGGARLLGIQASGSRSPSPNAYASQHQTDSSGLGASGRGLGAGLNAATSPLSNGKFGGAVTPRISRPLPVPRSDQSSDSNNSTHSFHSHHPIANSLCASIHSTTSSTASSHHSRDAPLLSGRSQLPLAPPTLNIETKPAKDVDDEGEEEDGDGLQTPVVPSEKALGKRRAVSVRYPSPPLGAVHGQRQQPPPLPPHPTAAARGEVVDGFDALRL